MELFKIRNSLWEDKKRERKANSALISILGTVVFIALSLILLFSTVFFSIQVSGSSMNDTLVDKDFVVASRDLTPKKGDIVIIENVLSFWIIKRVVAVGGDIVRIYGGDLYINGEKMDEPYAKGKTFVNDIYNDFIFTVPDGEIFFLGDNRENSTDSRYVDGHSTPLKNVVGVVMKWSIATKYIRNFFYRIFAFPSSCRTGG